MRVMEDEVFEGDDVTVEPQAGAAVGKMGPGDRARLDRAAAHRSSRRARRSSAAASDAAKAAQGNGSGSLEAFAIELITLIRNA